MNIRNIFRGCALLLFCFCATASAQDADGAAKPRKPSALGVRQQRVERMMEDLERKLKSLSQTLQKTEPERAKRLIEAMQQAKQLLIQQRMNQVTKLLDEASLDTASSQQEQILSDLRSLINLLLNEDEDLDKKLQELERMRQWKEQINRILDEERPQRRESEKIADKKKTLDDLAAQIKAVEKLIAKQEKVIAETEKKSADGIQGLGRVADKQRDVRKETESLAAEIAKKGGAPSDPKDGNQQASSSSEPGHRSLQQASGNQREAERNLQNGKSKDAIKDEQRALNDLKRALEEMKKESRRIASLPPEAMEKQAKKQDDTNDKTARLEEQMKKAAKSNGGNSSGGKSPGQKQVQQAQQSMKRASDDLRQQDPSGAERQQREAIKQLEQALQEIEQRLAQLREETQVEKLARLEARFREMLARQQKVTLSTGELDKKRASNGKLRRVERLAISKLAVEERALAEMSQQALDIIIEDGTSVVFASVVQGLRDDLNDVEQFLKAQRTDQYTQQFQQEIETTLRELIEALKRVQKQKKAGGGGGGGGGGQQPLLPGSAELKLLRASQLRVNRRTKALQVARADTPLDDVLKKEVYNIAERQLEIAILTERILDRN